MVSAALFVIDFQEHYLDDFSTDQWFNLARNISTVIGVLECAPDPIPAVHVAFTPKKHFPNRRGIREGVHPWKNVDRELQKDLTDWEKRPMTSSYNFQRFLTPDTLVAFKDDYSLATNTACSDWLRGMGSPTIILAGLWLAGPTTELDKCCVSATARDFRKAGFEVVIAEDATDRSVRRVAYETPELLRRYHQHLGVELMPLPDLVRRFVPQLLEAPAIR